MKNDVNTSYKKLFLFQFIFLFLFELIYSHRSCGIDFLKKPQRVLIKQEKENRRMLTQGDWEPIRIHLDFSYIENNLGRMKRQDYIDLKEKIMPKTAEVFEKILKVKRIQHKLKLNAPHCETFPIPEKYNTEGVDADIVIFVLLDNSGFFADNRIEAAAIHCLQHYETRRPIAGYIQFKQDLHVNNSTALDYMVWLAVHEVSHILVINNGLYDDYINPDTLQPHGFDRIIGSKTHPTGKKMNYIKSKNVLEKAKKHFNCDNLEGVPLEYNGGAGTAGAHWSKRYMNTDYMIGDSYGENLISDITLALFEDSGWYKVNYDLSNLFLWGKGKGCDFFSLNKKCVDFDSKTKEIKTDFKSEFCTKLNYPVCSPGNVFRASCYAKIYKNELNVYERYFSNSTIGGFDQLTDKCPIAFEEKEGFTYYGGSCRVGHNPKNQIEKVCPECACFMSSLRLEGSERKDLNRKMSRMKQLRFQQKDDKVLAEELINTKKIISEKLKINSSTNSTILENKNYLLKEPNTDAVKTQPEKRESPTNVDAYFKEDPELTVEDLNAGCFEFKCKDDGLYVMINTKSIRCPSSELVTLAGYSGNILCPDNEVICNNKYRCKFGCTDKY